MAGEERARAAELSMLLYVSESTIPQERAAEELHVLVERAKSRNLALGVTGSLVFTGHEFAQVLEGHPEDLTALMTAIRRDTRNTKVKVCFERPIHARQFPDWTLAYAGPSNYIARRVAEAAVSNDAFTAEAPSASLIALMTEFRGARSNRR